VRILEQLGVFQKGLIKAMVLSILLERPLVKQLDLADGPNFSDASRKSIGVESPFRCPKSGRLGFAQTVT
jgi:hypothetical protein